MPFGRGFGWRGGRGRGRGNPYPFCRNFPWLPRGWWTGMYGPMTPFTGTPRMPYYAPPYSMNAAPIWGVQR